MMSFLKRQIRVKAPTGGGGSSSVLQSSDLTYLGAYKLPRIPFGDYDSIYGDGLTVRRESSDTGNELHLLSAGFNASPNHGVYEFRNATPGNGSPDPTDPANYTTATVVKTYGDVYSGKKRIIYDGDDQEMTAQLDGGYGLYWDEVDERLYWSYGFGYSNDDDSWCVGYSTLNYAGNSGTGHGPWRLSAQSWKGIMAGMTGVPSGYASTYLGGKRLALGFGGYYSLVASCDASIGPSLTAIDPIAAAEESSLASTPLVGYWPFASSPTGSNGRGPRPEARLNNATPEYDIDIAWAANYQTWNDRVRSGTWIDTGSKRGMIFLGTYGKEYSQYLSSQIHSSKFGFYLAIYDPMDFTPVSSTARYNIQPDSIFEITFPTIDTTQAIYAGGASKSITSITSTNGTSKATTGNTVVTVPSHGYSNDASLEIRGSSQAIYNGMWLATPLDANTFGIRNTSLGSNWNGAAATGGTVYSPVGNTPDKPIGMAYDSVTGLLFIAIAVAKGVNGINSAVFVHVYQVSQS